MSEQIQTPETEIADRYYISVSHIYSVRWMPGTLTKTYEFQAPIVPFFGPSQYRQFIVGRIGAKSRDAVNISFSKFKPHLLRDLPQLYSRSELDEIYAENDEA